MINLVLNKESSASEIKQYFEKVLELSQSGNEFPINLDEVWPLIYDRKDHAVRELIKSRIFTQYIDYKVFPKKGENIYKNTQNLKGGRPTEEYHLSIPCMEFLIARKVRPVFDVYRTVFHSVMQGTLSHPAPSNPQTSVQETVKKKPDARDTIRFIGFCRQIGFPEADLLEMTMELVMRQSCMDAFIGTMMTLRDEYAMRDTTLRQVALAYAQKNGLPMPAPRGEAEVVKPEKKPRPEPQQRVFMHELMSARKLLEKTGLSKSITPKELNASLYERGILGKAVLEHKHDSLGNRLSEWQVTKEGSYYGRNSQTREGKGVRPVWWADRFMELLRTVDLPKEKPEQAGKEAAL